MVLLALVQGVPTCSSSLSQGLRGKATSAGERRAALKEEAQNLPMLTGAQHVQLPALQLTKVVWGDVGRAALA